MKKVKTGDVYTLGEHRLICGDCRELETINKLMNGRRANLVFTDPPYGMKKAGVANDNMNLTDMLAFNGEWIQKSMDVLDSNGSWYCWGKDEQIMLIYATILRPMIERNEIVFRNLITWEKPSVPGQLSDTHRMYPVADEKCLFVMKGTQGFNNNADGFYEGFEPIRSYLDEQRKIMGWTAKDIRNITGVTSVARHAFSRSQWELPTEEHYNKMREACRIGGELQAFDKEYKAFYKEYKAFKREYDDIKQEFYNARAYFDNTHEIMTQTWLFNRASPEEYAEAFKFPTIKPVELCSRAIKSSSREGDLVVDFFGGSGSTLIACEELGRTCYMIELVPEQVSKIIERWEKKTGREAKREPRVAHWISEDNVCRCSACGFDRGESLFAFCPICGAEILGAG